MKKQNLKEQHQRESNGKSKIWLMLLVKTWLNYVSKSRDVPMSVFRGPRWCLWPSDSGLQHSTYNPSYSTERSLRPTAHSPPSRPIVMTLQALETFTSSAPAASPSNDGCYGNQRGGSSHGSQHEQQRRGGRRGSRACMVVCVLHLLKKKER